mmetsp:Transcript_20303/g.19989  ORF Transcript_20303/g.19989 Transcript_20303/m.19989 type:complete len:235 (+) Transcript_20303:391-1095(+)
MYVETDLYDRDTFYQYLIAFYHSVMMLNGNEVGPRSFLQYVFVSAFLMVGAILQSNIFGNMAVIVQEMNQKASRFQEKIDIANTSMKNIRLPLYLQKKVRDYLFYTQSNLETQRELEDFQTMISPSLKLEVTRHIFLQVLISNPIFGDNPELNEMVIEKVSVNSYPPEAIITQQGGNPDGMYINSKGELAVLVKDEYNKQSFVRILESGDIFGEVALIAECPRTATVQCLNYCT